MEEDYGHDLVDALKMELERQRERNHELKKIINGLLSEQALMFSGFEQIADNSYPHVVIVEYAGRQKEIMRWLLEDRGESSTDTHFIHHGSSRGTRAAVQFMCKDQAARFKLFWG